jgi:AcrR family transcriptional regulator
MRGVGYQGEPLPRGPHGLSREHVQRSQRERLMRAMEALVAERGYAATTVPDVVTVARVDRNAFYRHFSDKADCFIAVCDEAASDLLEKMAAGATSQHWIDALRAGTDVYLRHWQDRPTASRAYFLELPVAGQRAVAQRARQYRRFERTYEGLAALARVQQPELPPLQPIVPRILVGAIAEFVGEEVRAGRVGSLTRHAPELVHLAVRLIADDATADRLRRER